MKERIGFALVVEAGDLERKAMLLIESIREFGGSLKNAPIWAIQPRRGAKISQKTFEFFARFQVFYVFADVNRIWSDYDLANKPCAAALIEPWVSSDVSTLCFLDTDTLFLQPPVDLILSKNVDVALRPIHLQENNCGWRLDEPENAFWTFIFDVSHTHRGQLWPIETTVDQCRIWAYFNSGLIAVNPEKGIFQCWQDNLNRLQQDNRCQQYFQQAQYQWFIEQAMFTATILANIPYERVFILDKNYNYPLNLHLAIPENRRTVELDELIHVHYHQLFYKIDWFQNIRMSDRMKTWLLHYLPLEQSGLSSEKQNLSMKRDIFILLKQSLSRYFQAFVFSKS